MDFSGKHILVLGLGESGLAMAQWLFRCGARLRVADTRKQPERLAALMQISSEIEFVGGEFDLSLLDEIDVVAVSPGLSPLLELADLLPQAQQKNIPVWGETELFAQALAALREQRAYSPKLIAITGTNGKTTVTNLTGLLCQRAGLTTKVAGNISPAMLDVLRECLETDSLPQVWVLELSSFQLHTCFSLQADAATVLNLTQDHLDWHGDFSSYCSDKARIFAADTIQILNRDDPAVMAMATVHAQSARKIHSFGTGAPQQDGDLGLLSEHGMSWLAIASAGDEEPGSGRRKKKDAVETTTIVTRLMPADALKIRGQHNATNALAALALCRAIGLPLAPLLHALREYRGEPHRVELVANIGGVDYIDDSKGTNVGATVAALKGLGQETNASEKRIILIAGGEGKGQNFQPLCDPLARYVKAVLLIGTAAQEMDAAIQPAQLSSQLSSQLCQSLEQAVQMAAELAHSGDVVLLSPACASFDMFRNYAHRAEVFIAAVREIALNRGEVF